MRKIFTSLALFFLWSAPLLQAQEPSDARVSQSLILAENALIALQDEVNPMHVSLVEPLSALADQQMALGQFEQAHRNIDRALQILRVSEGLYTQSQYPLQSKKITNMMNARDWESARTQLDHVIWLYTRKSKYATPQLLRSLSQLSDMHMRGISEDSGEFQAFHFNRAQTSNWISLAIAESLWGDTDERVVPLMYKIVNQFHLEFKAINRRGRTSLELRTIVPGSTWVREIHEMKAYYFSTGYDLLSRIKKVYEASEDSEALAMVSLYLADWLMLFDQHDEALEGYKNAHQELAAAGVDYTSLESFMAKPRLLPESQFFSSLNLAMASNEEVPVEADTTDNANPEAQLFFAEWSPKFPYVQQPQNINQGAAPLADIAIFSFNIGGFPDISRLVDGRKPLGFGVVEDLSLLTAPTLSLSDERRLLERVSSLRFRPKLVEGVPHEADAKLIYALASPL